MTHDADPRLARHVANCRTKATRWGEHIRKDHPDSPRRIDLAMAAVIAFDRAGYHAAHPPTKFISAYETERLTFTRT